MQRNEQALISELVNIYGRQVPVMQFLGRLYGVMLLGIGFMIFFTTPGLLGLVLLVGLIIGAGVIPVLILERNERSFAGSPNLVQQIIKRIVEGKKA